MERADKAGDLLGLARRAGKLTLGAGATESAFGRGSICALVLASDTAPRPAMKFKALAHARGVPCYSFSSKGEFGRRFGRQEVGILGVLDRFLAGALARHFEQHPPAPGAAAGNL